MCGLLFSRVDLVLMKSCSSEKPFFPSNYVKTNGSDCIFFNQIHLQLRSSRWHFIIKHRLLFLLRPPHRTSKFIIIHKDSYYAIQWGVLWPQLRHLMLGSVTSLFTGNHYSLATTYFLRSEWVRKHTLTLIITRFYISMKNPKAPLEL